MRREPGRDSRISDFAICGNAQHSRRGRERRDRHRHVPSCRLRLVPREPRPRGPPPANEERRTKARNEERFCLCRMSGLSADCAPRGWGDRLGTPRRRDGRHAFGRAVPEKRARADSQSSHHPPRGQPVTSVVSARRAPGPPRVTRDGITWTRGEHARQRESEVSVGEAERATVRLTALAFARSSVDGA